MKMARSVRCLAFHTAPPTSVSGCAYSGVAGSIYEKTASMDNPVFGSGRGTPIMQAGSSSNLNHVTGRTERWEAPSGQIAELADRVQATAGHRTATWTMSAARAVAVWRTELKPAT